MGVNRSLAYMLVLISLACGSDPDEGSVPTAATADRIEPWDGDGECLGSSTVVCPGESIQAKVDAAPPGTEFTIKAGIHRSQRVTPKSGNTFTGEPGAILDGEGVTQFAFEGGAVGVLIKDLEIRNYATLCTTVPDNCLGAIQGYDASDWTLENLNVHHNAGAGANLHGRVTVRGGSFHHNARLGIGVSGGDSALIDGVELAYNNPDRLFDPLWEAGGIKVAVGNNVTVRGCHVHHNVGPAIWYDIDNRGGVISDNLVTDNAYVGVFYEISYAGVIQGNTVTGNGTATTGPIGAGILVAASQDVEVHHNAVRGNAGGIVGLQEERGSGQFGPYLMTDLWVHDNDVDLTHGAAGLLNFMADGSLYTRNNRFDRNAYDITGNALPFLIDGLIPASRSTWQARGQDPNSTFIGP
jgi:parallel beta-helix repeat protein